VLVRGLFYVAVAAATWATGGAVAAVLYRTSGLGPLAVSFWRFVVAIAVLAVVGRFSVQMGNWRRAAALGFGLAVYQTAYYGSVEAAGLAVATVITLGAGPVLIAVGARVLLDERLSRTGAASVAVAVVGLLLLIGVPAPAGPSPALGVALALLSAAGYSAVTLYTRAGRDDATQPGMVAGFVWGALWLLPLAAVEGLRPGVGAVGWLLYLGAVPTALAYGLFFAGLRMVPATTASVVALVEPVTAALIAVALLGEQVTVTTVIGSTLMLGAVALLAADARHTPGPA